MGKNVIDILAEILILLIFSNKSNSSQCQHLHTSMLKGESHVSRNVPASRNFRPPRDSDKQSLIL